MNLIFTLTKLVRWLLGAASHLNSHNFDHRTQHHYHDAPEPIIEIIIQDNNETLPPPEPIALNSDGKPKKEQVQVFYVKYKKDQHDQLIIGKLHDLI